ncbi:MAG: L-seryl-tRNA(Sec) selenium transferase [Burkholderiales bacterium]|jgi:L-seryl-tRNA(Ser) seleniumtransferase|nr:L-seryl-tRNA(Sec) selenium transferase [Burkholderiales bacterium]
MVNPAAAARRALPSVDRLLGSAAVAALIAAHGRSRVTEILRRALDTERERLAQPDAAWNEELFLQSCSSVLQEGAAPSLKPVFNLTGTVLHTNLGRAVMPKSAAEAVMAAMTRPVNLEFELDTGGRGERDSHVERWLKQLTGGEKAVAVNNNAAAVYLALNTLALKREVLVSRGELIEIGGAFRIPDIMARAGVKLVEVGTTNRTHLKDFAEAITPRTAAIMKVHTSNYVVQGFTATVPEADLAKLAHEHDLPFIVDLGSGTLIDLEQYGLPHEPTPRETLAHGADVVTFSGDKLLGGPQAGLLVGRRDLMARIAKNPMKRALRLDKLTLTALDAVLRLYLHPERLHEELPALRLLTRKADDIAAQAARVLPQVTAALGEAWRVEITACKSQIGSGALPVDALPSSGLAMSPSGKKGNVGKLATAFRALPVPVIGHIKDGAFVLDLRCLDHEDEFVAQLGQLKVKGF